jgi:hypothetical protein
MAPMMMQGKRVKRIGRAGCPDEERLLSNLWTMYWLKRNNSPYLKGHSSSDHRHVRGSESVMKRQS